MDFVKILKIPLKLKYRKIFNRRAIYYLTIVTVAIISYFVFRYTPKRWVSASFDYGGLFDFSLQSQKKKLHHNINLFSDNFMVSLSSTEVTNSSDRFKASNHNKLGEEKPAFIINFPAWSAGEFQNEDQILHGMKKEKGNLDIFISTKTDMLENCPEGKDYITFKCAELTSRNALKFLDKPIQAESFNISIFFLPRTLPLEPDYQAPQSHLSKREKEWRAYLLPTRELHLLLSSLSPKTKDLLHLNLVVDDKDYFFIGQKGFDIKSFSGSIRISQMN